MGRDPRGRGSGRWGRQFISSRTIGAPCALRKLQKGEGTTGEWSRAPRGGRRRRRFGNGKGQRRGGGLGTCGPRPGRSAVLRRAAPQAALEVGRVPHGRIRADERVPAGAAALHEPRVVVHLARERLPHGLAPRRRGSRRTPRRRGGGTLLGGFVWTRVDAADARIPPLSVFSGGAKCQS